MSEQARRSRGLGAGLVSGASANDPTTVATLAVIGASTVYGLSFLVILIIPMLIAVQTISAHVGAVRHAGFAGIVRERFGGGWALAVMAAVVLVNLLTLAADLEGGAAALSLLTGAAFQWFVAPLGLVAAYLLLSRQWTAIERGLQFVPLIFFAYVGSTLLAHPDWGRVFHDTLLPMHAWNRYSIAGAIALLGTTLTSYEYVWQIVSVAESRPALVEVPRARLHAGFGIVISGVAFWFILVGTGATLGVHGAQVQTAAEAASALAPLAGGWSSALFALGLLSSAVLAIPVIAATTAHVVADALGRPASLNLPPRETPTLTIALIATVVCSCILAYAGMQPIELLIFSSIVGGIATPFTLALLVRVARDSKAMNGYAIGAPLAAAGWVVTGIVTAAALAYLVTYR